MTLHSTPLGPGPCGRLDSSAEVSRETHTPSPGSPKAVAGGCMCQRDEVTGYLLHAVDCPFHGNPTVARLLEATGHGKETT